MRAQAEFAAERSTSWLAQADLAQASLLGQINLLNEQDAIRHMLERLVKIVGPEANRAFRGGVRFGWSADPFALGGYSYAVPGQARARDALRRPVGERLWFAGEACAGKASMTVAGAHETGAHAAQAIAAKLRGTR